MYFILLRTKKYVCHTRMLICLPMPPLAPMPPPPPPPPSSSEAAQQRFGTAKSISSDQYFGRNSSDSLSSGDANLSRFSGATSISSDAYFGRNQSSSSRRGRGELQKDLMPRIFVRYHSENHVISRIILFRKGHHMCSMYLHIWEYMYVVHAARFGSEFTFGRDVGKNDHFCVDFSFGV